MGKTIAGYMRDIGINSVDDLRGRDAEELYQQLCEYQGVKVDRCMLYVFRCSIYYASNTKHDPELLKWYNHKSRGVSS